MEFTKRLKDTFGDISFPSFVQQVLDTVRYKLTTSPDPVIDAHWRPFHLRCGYCDIKYDLIGKMETFQEDMEAVFKARNITGYKLKKQLNVHKSSGITQEQRIHKYFKTLTPELKMRLYQLYQFDFELFGYKAKHFL